MKTFTIDNHNNITAFPTPDHAEAAVGVGAHVEALLAPLVVRLQAALQIALRLLNFLG